MNRYLIPHLKIALALTIVGSSVVIGKLGSYTRQNKVAKVFRKMGRIEKTIFILDYLSDKTLRRKVQRASVLSIRINTIIIYGI